MSVALEATGRWAQGACQAEQMLAQVMGGVDGDVGLFDWHDSLSCNPSNTSEAELQVRQLCN